MAQYLIAHDLGTSGNKASLFSTEGSLIRSVVKHYPCHYFNGNWAEQDPNDWYRAVCEATRELIADTPAADIIGMSFSGHMMGAVSVDAAGEALRPAIIWADQRAAAQEKIIAQTLGNDRFYAITGARNSCTNSLHKLMWLRDNEPDTYRRIHKVLNSKDYIICRLTGNFGTDYSDASGTGAFDVTDFTWSREILEAVKIDPDKFPQLHASTDLAGRVTAQAAAATGLPEGTPVFCGCGDGAAATVGSGACRPGEAYCSLGSSAWICCLSEKPYFDPKMRTFNIAGIKKGQVYPLGTMQAAGLSYEWMKQTLCDLELYKAQQGQGNIYDLINRQILSVPAGAGGVMYLPYIMGERSPWWNDQATGAFVGLRKETTKPEMLRAVLEGVAMNLALIYDALSANGSFEQLTIIGAAAREPMWRTLLADVLGCRIAKPNHVEEACSMGACIVAGIGAGVYQDATAVEKFLKTEEVTAPNAENHEKYAAMLERFAAVYRGLNP